MQECLQLRTTPPISRLSGEDINEQKKRKKQPSKTLSCLHFVIHIQSSLSSLHAFFRINSESAFRHVHKMAANSHRFRFRHRTRPIFRINLRHSLGNTRPHPSAGDSIHDTVPPALRWMQFPRRVAPSCRSSHRVTSNVSLSTISNGVVQLSPFIAFSSSGDDTLEYFTR